MTPLLALHDHDTVYCGFGLWSELGLMFEYMNRPESDKKQASPPWPEAQLSGSSI
ncbi:hypothetical protein RchiOBHm_Chr5g0059561 [Rosa chinensis]|uniref:Uncharacterized protein n=1 Tax=Rosa chinensis TaxID=74649 RepID=A0A2P6QHG1_ROSCH|nr:hypothetical protein RchiOBHm_Chr5g0059561 [Rosa chinensis]